MDPWTGLGVWRRGFVGSANRSGSVATGSCWTGKRFREHREEVLSGRQTVRGVRRGDVCRTDERRRELGKEAVSDRHDL